MNARQQSTGRLAPSSASSLSDYRRAQFLATASSRHSASGFGGGGYSGSKASQGRGDADSWHPQVDPLRTVEFVPETEDELYLARLEPCGIRRQVRRSTSRAPSSASAETAGSSAPDRHAADDAPSTAFSGKPALSHSHVSYVCVACDNVIGAVDEAPASHAGDGGMDTRRHSPSTAKQLFDVLQAAYLHCGAATHRRALRFMALDETDAALALPLAPNPDHCYSITLNGIRMLVSSLLGGSGMFFNPVTHGSDDRHQHQQQFDLVAGSDPDGGGGHASSEARLNDRIATTPGGIGRKRPRGVSSSRTMANAPSSDGQSISAGEEAPSRMGAQKCQARLYFPRSALFTESVLRVVTTRDASTRKRDRRMKYGDLVNRRIARVPLAALRGEHQLFLQELMPRKRRSCAAAAFTPPLLPASASSPTRASTSVTRDDEEEAAARRGGDGAAADAPSAVAAPGVLQYEPWGPPVLLAASVRFVTVCDGGVYRLRLIALPTAPPPRPSLAGSATHAAPHALDAAGGGSIGRAATEHQQQHATTCDGQEGVLVATQLTEAALRRMRDTEGDSSVRVMFNALRRDDTSDDDDDEAAEGRSNSAARDSDAGPAKALAGSSREESSASSRSSTSSSS